MAENGERPTVEGAIRGALMKLIARDAKKRGGEMARYGFLPSRLWQMLRAEMNADGMAVVPPTGTPDGFPAIMLGGVPLYADDCDDHDGRDSGGHRMMTAWTPEEIARLASTQRRHLMDVMDDAASKKGIAWRLAHEDRAWLLARCSPTTASPARAAPSVGDAAAVVEGAATAEHLRRGEQPVSQHTPGPWILGKSEGGERLILGPATGAFQAVIVAKVTTGNIADDWLIQHAPDLLAALERLMLDDEHAPGCPGPKYHDRPEHDCEAIRKCVVARAVIAKARGESRPR